MTPHPPTSAVPEGPSAPPEARLRELEQRAADTGALILGHDTVASIARDALAEARSLAEQVERGTGWAKAWKFKAQTGRHWHREYMGALASMLRAGVDFCEPPRPDGLRPLRSLAEMVDALAAERDALATRLAEVERREARMREMAIRWERAAADNDTEWERGWVEGIREAAYELRAALHPDTPSTTTGGTDR